MADRVPIVILAGSDRHAAVLPPSGKGLHPLTGYKGLDVRIDGRPIVSLIAERLAACPELGPIYLAGPGEAFGGVVEGVIPVDSDGSFGDNIWKAIERLRQDHPGKPMGFTVCDILPEPETLREMLEGFRRSRPCDLWFPLVRAPTESASLGESSWKPRYRLVPTPGEEAVEVLPGHLAIVDPAALRLDLAHRIVQIGYRTRNRKIGERRAAMARELLGELIGRDLASVASLRAPALTWSVAWTGWRAGSKLRNGTLPVAELEDALRRMFVHRGHRKRYPERRVRTPIVDALSLALDIDTEEEARQAGGEIRRSPTRARTGRPAPPPGP